MEIDMLENTKGTVIKVVGVGGAGGKGGTVGYLTAKAKENPTAFLSLLGKVLPMQIGSDEDNPLKMVHEIKRTVVRPRNPNG